MAAPTFVASYAYTAASTNADVTISLTNSAGDVLVCIAATEDNNRTLTTPTGGTGLTWTLQQSTNLASFAKVYTWTTTATAANTAATISMTRDTTSWASARILRFTGSDGIGASSATTTTTTGTPSLAITTTQANSAIVTDVADWNAIDATTRTWRTINGTTPTAGNGFETGYFRNASFGTTISAYWPDAGAAGAQTTGLTTPTTGWKWTAVAVEVKGTAGGGGGSSTPPPAILVPSTAVVRAAWW